MASTTLHSFPPLLAFYSHEIFTSKLLKVYPIFWSEVKVENENLGKNFYKIYSIIISLFTT